MKTIYNNRFLVLIITSFIFTSCEIVTFKDYALPPYDGALTWERVVKNAEWSNRYDHAAEVFDNKLWVTGGYNPGQVSGDTYYEDVWSSADGESWELVTDNAPWFGRRSHQLVNFNDGAGDALYLIGGFSVNEETGYRQFNNDVWKSTDGENWTLIKDRTYPSLSATDDWFPRMNHSCVVVNHGGTDYIYLIGGYSQLEGHESRYASEYFNDVWRSTDAVTWEKLANNDFGMRSELAACVDETGNLYINGGVHGIIFDAENNATHPVENWQALWISPDGESWTSARDSVVVEDRFLYRSGHEMVFYQDEIWSLPGKTVSNEHYMFSRTSYYGFWTYSLLNQFTLDSEGIDIDPRHSYEALVWQDKIWIIGGLTDTHGQSNDVWTGEK